MTIFQGTPQDIYIHWLVLALGIGVLVSGIAVITTCRSIAGFFHLLQGEKGFWKKIYSSFFKYHTYYWVAFWLFLVLHLLVTIFHVGLPYSGEPYKLAHQVMLAFSIINLLLVLAVFTSCRSFLTIIGFFVSRSPFSGNTFKRFYKLHSLLWYALSVSVIVHIIAGIIHAVNT